MQTGRMVTEARRNGGRTVVTLDDGSTLETDVVVVATGRTPRVQGIGLESVGVEPGKQGLQVDDRCSFGDGLWAVGDVTGEMLFTHVAKYQARVVAANILGSTTRADYRGIPRVVFSDPEVAAVGLTEDQARDAGMDVVTATVDLPEAIARPWTYEQDPRGQLGLLADRARGVLVGAWAVAPMSGQWIHQASLAIRAEVPIAKLLDTAAQFPTYSEAYLSGLEKLDL